MTPQALQCRRCRKIYSRDEQVPVKKDRYGMTTMGCPNCGATVFILVEGKKS